MIKLKAGGTPMWIIRRGFSLATIAEDGKGGWSFTASSGSVALLNKPTEEGDLLHFDYPGSRKAEEVVRSSGFPSGWGAIVYPSCK